MDFCGLIRKIPDGFKIFLKRVFWTRVAIYVFPTNEDNSDWSSFQAGSITEGNETYLEKNLFWATAETVIVVFSRALGLVDIRGPCFLSKLINSRWNAS